MFSGAAVWRNPLRSVFAFCSRMLPRTTRALPWLLASSAVFSTQLSQAQTRVEPVFSVQRFQPAVGPRNYLVTRGARTDGRMLWTFGGVASYAYKPFVVRSCRTVAGESCSEPGAQLVQDVKVVENLVTADLMASLTPFPRLQLGLRAPLTWLNGQGIDDRGFNDPDRLSAVGPGDPELEAKLRVAGGPDDLLVLGLALSATAPLGYAVAKDKYLGDSTATLGGRVIIDGRQGPFAYAVNLGGLLRGEGEVGRTQVGSEARFSAAAGFQLSPVFRVLADFYGSTRFTSSNGENTLEGMLAAQVNPLTTPLGFVLGAGAGLVTGVGVPDVRVVAGLSFALENVDDDGDGIDNHRDRCPTEVEDNDGYEDVDGCPDHDNDVDAIADAMDRCPSQPEDMDGFQDADGCADLDNDQDALADTADQCPLEPETRNGYQDSDGCPDEPDSDNDGVPDLKDKCPTDPEDTDGSADTDGCPDPDNDQDAVLDEQDECIDEPETVNEFQDEDGCPDEAPVTAPGKKKR